MDGYKRVFWWCFGGVCRYVSVAAIKRSVDGDGQCFREHLVLPAHALPLR